MANSGIKMGTFHLYGHPKWSKIVLGKHIFHRFWPIFGPKTAHFQGIL